MDLPGMTDKEIWIRFTKGDDHAFSWIYSEYSQKLYHYGLKFTRSHFLVEDVLQDLFAELLKNRKRLGTTDNILYYLLKSFKRKLLRKIQSEQRFEFNEGAEDHYFEVRWSVEHDMILEEISAEKMEMLVRALNELSSRQKEAIYLRFSKELDYPSVAGIMNISVEACRNLISKAIRIMKVWVSESRQNPMVFFVSSFR